jgi:hypothetical protein
LVFFFLPHHPILTRFIEDQKQKNGKKKAPQALYQTKNFQEVKKGYQKYNSFLVKNNGCLDGALILHRLQTLSPLLEFERLVDDALHLNLARVKVTNGGRKHISFRKGPDDRDFIPKDLARRPRNTGSVAVDPVHHQLSATAAIVDGILQDFRRTGGL